MDKESTISSCVQISTEKTIDRYRYAASHASVNPGEAMAIALELIDEGFPEAAFLVGAIFESRGDFDQACSYYDKAFKDGDSLLACVGIARLNLLGKCKGASSKKAFEYYSLLLETEDHPMAKMMLGRMYLEGIWVAQDMDKAESLLLEASQEKYVFAFSFLSRLYFTKGNYIKSLCFSLKGVKAYILSDRSSLSSSYI